MKPFLAILIFISTLSFNAQTEFDELEFETKSIKTPYKPATKHHAFIRSKRGTSGLNRNPKADSVAALAITEIVLVFTEMDASEAAERDVANRERWENLLKTYPEYFEYAPATINVCQCNPGGDAEAFKQVQGFYIYFEGAEEPVSPAAKPEAPAVAKKEEPAAETPKPVKKAEEPARRREEPQETETPEPPKEIAKETTKEKKRGKEKKEETEAPASMDLETFPDLRAAKTPAPRKAGFSKPKRAKDPKACRPACYEGGDEDLYAFFRDNITLSKKQKKKNKSLVSMVKLQLNFDGSVKKSFVTGENAALNQQVEQALTTMNLWNPTVKNGLTVKSEVKFTLKYDRETKAMKPFDLVVTPRLPVKCKCVSDEELFGSN